MIISPPVIILGTARSGSSLTAGLLHKHGFWVGECRPPDERNPKGYFENDALKKLRLDGPVYFKEVQHILERQGYSGGPWLVKHGPQHWWNWMPLSPRFILCRRTKGFSVASWMKHVPPSPITERWQKARVKRDHAEMDKVRDQYGGIDFRPGSLERGFDELADLFSKLGVDLNEEICRDFYDRNLWSGG